MACAKAFPPLAQCRTTAASAETRSSGAAAVSPATATTAPAGSKDRTAAPVRQRKAAGLRSCATPRFDSCAARISLADHHARMQEQQQLGCRTAGGMGRKQPVELAGFEANLLTVKCDAGDIVAGPAFRASSDNDIAAFRFDEFDPSGIRKRFFGGIDDLDQRAVGAGCRQAGEHVADL